MKKNLLIIFLAIYFICGYSFGQSKDISKVGPTTEKVDLAKYKQVFYVSQINGSDKDGNGSRVKPWSTILFALNIITQNSKDNVTALLVAAGIYKDGTVQMKSYVDIFGGFSNTSWERDIHANPTILDGDYSRRVAVGADDARIDGVSIIKGIARSDGGGILCDDTSPEISNCFIVNNYVMEPENFNYTRIHQKGNMGGGIACRYNGIPTIRNNIFYNNRTSIGDGGALSFFGWLRERHATDKRIENNFMEGSGRAVVRNNVFIQNTAGVNDISQSRTSNGGAISCSNESRPIIENNIIVSNRAKGNSDAGAIYVEDFSYPTINDNWIVGNISDDDAGGIYVMHLSHAVITNNFIAGNWTMNGGAGGVRLSKEGRALISDNIIVNNQSGGAIQCVDSYMELKNNIIMNNKGKISIKYSNNFSYFVPSLIEKNIILENEGKIGIELRKNETITVNNNNVNEQVTGKDNSYKQIGINNKSITGDIVKNSFDGKIFQTIIETKNIENAQTLLGRTIRIGDFWSVVCKVDKNKFNVWGNVSEKTADNSNFEILPNYEMQK
ncbi:MAG: right-handed parallel beta-helix repeat-containing protein [Ignavibacteriales bacterium]|nr:right-handed parallel beta-helix repeat-containing protein [Ignavibacteriales bacterium]